MLPLAPAPEAGASLLGYALKKNPSALNPDTRHYFGRARPLRVNRFTWENDAAQLMRNAPLLVLVIFAAGAPAIAPGAEHRTLVLLVEPAEKLLETFVGKNSFYRIERVAQFVMAPRLVDKILARMARGHDLLAALATRHHVMSSRRHFALTEYAAFRHVVQGYQISRFCASP